MPKQMMARLCKLATVWLRQRESQRCALILWWAMMLIGQGVLVADLRRGLLAVCRNDTLSPISGEPIRTPRQRPWMYTHRCSFAPFLLYITATISTPLLLHLYSIFAPKLTLLSLHFSGAGA